jgi:hypothetical protein
MYINILPGGLKYVFFVVMYHPSNSDDNPKRHAYLSGSSTTRYYCWSRLGTSYTRIWQQFGETTDVGPGGLQCGKPNTKPSGKSP